jgi:hypothetical protein
MMNDRNATKAFWLMVVLLVVLFIWGLCSSDRVFAHETHLSGVGEQTVTSSTPCPALSGYVIESEERGCYLIYKQTDLQHSGLHVQDNFPRDGDGDCACPKGD